MRLENISVIGFGFYLAGLVTLAFIISFTLWGFEVSPIWLIPLSAIFVVAEIAMATLKQRLDQMRQDD